jgi:O-antigen/teichoic acid export membrane protein
MSKPGRRIVRNVSVLAGSQLTTWSATFLWMLVIPRALGPSAMGFIVTAWAATGIMAVLMGLGTRNYLVREMVATPERRPALLGTALLLRVGLLAPALLVMVAYAFVAHFPAVETQILYLATAATCLALLGEPLLAGFQAIERMEYIAYGDVINKGVQSLGGIGLVLIGFGARALAVWWVAVMAIVLALSLWWMRHHIAIDFSFDLGRIRALLRESVAYWTFGVFFTVYLWIDSVMLAAMTPAAVVGWYGVPTKLFNALMFAPVILATAWLPRLVSAFGESPERLRVIARTPVELVVIISLPVAAGAALIATPLIRALYGPAFAPAAPVFAILALACVPMYLNIMLNQVLIAEKRQAVWTRVMILACVLNPALNFVLIRVFQQRSGNGAVGAAVSLLVTEFVLGLVGLLIVTGLFNRPFVERLLRATVATAGMVLAVWAVRSVGLVAQVAVGAVIYPPLALVLGVASAEQVAGVRRLSGRLGQLIPARQSAR